jgi:hypothetical protein
MKQLNLKDVIEYVEENIGTFHEKRIQRIKSLRLAGVLKRKNPYLFKAKNVLTAEQIIKGFLDAHVSSNEETIFGDWLEGLAIFINSRVHDGKKSGIPGIDLEFDKNGIRYIVNIKSGPNWGNASQIAKMRNDFIRAKKTLRTGNSGLNVIAVNGCCYGKERNPDKGDYFKYCGQEFWSFISDEYTLYQDIVEPLGIRAKEKNDEFLNNYSNVVNMFTREFTSTFCLDNGEINWEKLLHFNSGSEKTP